MKLPDKMKGNLLEILDYRKFVDIGICINMTTDLPESVNILLFVNDYEKQEKFKTKENDFLAIFSPNGDEERDKWTDFFMTKLDLKLVGQIEAYEEGEEGIGKEGEAQEGELSYFE